jgi:hypothetical protein
MQWVLALLKERRVSLEEALRRFSPKCSLLETGVRTYTVCDARVLVIMRNQVVSTLV